METTAQMLHPDVMITMFMRSQGHGLSVMVLLTSSVNTKNVIIWELANTLVCLFRILACEGGERLPFG